MNDTVENKLEESLQTANKSAVDSLQGMIDINTNIFTRLLKQQISISKLFSDLTCKQLELFSTTRNYKELLNEESQVMQEFANSTEEVAQEALAALEESKQEVNKWIKKGMENAENTAAAFRKH